MNTKELLLEAKNSLAGFPKTLIQKVVNLGGGAGSEMETAPVGRNKISAALKSNDVVGLLGYYEKTRPGYLIVHDEYAGYTLYVTKALVALMKDSVEQDSSKAYDRNNSKAANFGDGTIRPKEYKYYAKGGRNRSGYFYKERCSLTEILDLLPQGGSVTTYIIKKDPSKRAKREERSKNKQDIANSQKSKVDGKMVAKSLVKLLSAKVDSEQVRDALNAIDLNSLKGGYDLEDKVKTALKIKVKEMEEAHQKAIEEYKKTQKIAELFYDIRLNDTSANSMPVYKKAKELISQL